MVHEGYLYTKLSDRKVVCGICPHRVHYLRETGACAVPRSIIDGTLYSISYGNPCSKNVDPIEKKPLFHFKPRTKSFSMAAAGCNFRCLNCQNWEISQSKPDEVRHSELFPEDVVRAALEKAVQNQFHTHIRNQFLISNI